MAATFFPQLPKIHIPQKMTSFYRPRRSISEHQAVAKRQMSMSLVNKGLLNPTGENNCFLNSAVQVLWHIDVFRRSFREFKGHTCIGECCIFCSLKSLFNDIQYSQLAAIPPDNLRQSMALCYKEQRRFQLGLMDDAAECFEKLLEQIHYHLTGNEDMDICGASFCLSHQKFALTILERTECVCGATSEPLSFVQFVHYISSAAIVKEAQKLEDPNQQTTPTTTPTEEAQLPVTTPTPRHVSSSAFGHVLNAASAFGEFRECPNYRNCKKTVSVKRILMNAPDVVCLGLIWDSDQPPVSDIMAVVNTIGLTLRLSEVFDQVITDGARINEYHLSALIAYYGRHYSTFCYHGALKEWTYFDDAKFRTIGKEWSDVCEEIRKAHYQPLLLVYSNTFADVLDVSEASNKITLVNTGNHDNQLKHTTIAEENSEKSTNQIQDVNDANSVVTNQNEPLTSDNKVVAMPTETIDPLTFSIIPSSLPKVATNQNPASIQSSNETTVGSAQEKTTPINREATPTINESPNWMAQFDDPTSVAMTTHSLPSSNEIAAPDADLMTFSISPVTIATTQRNVIPTKLPIRQNEVPQSENSEDQDLIEFSLFPNSFYKKLSVTSPTLSVAPSGVQALPNKSPQLDLPLSDSRSSRSNSKTSELELIWEHFADPDTPTTPIQDPLPKFPPQPSAVEKRDSWAMVSTGGTMRSVSPDPPSNHNTSPAVRSLKRVSSYHGREGNKIQPTVTSATSRDNANAVPMTTTVSNTNSKFMQSTPSYVNKNCNQTTAGSHDNTAPNSKPVSNASTVGRTADMTTQPWRVVQAQKGRDQNKSHSPYYTEVAKPSTERRVSNNGTIQKGRGKPDPLYADPDEVLDQKGGNGRGSGRGVGVKRDLVYAELDFTPRVPNQQNAGKVSQPSNATHPSHVTHKGAVRPSHMTHKGAVRPAAPTNQQRTNPPIGLDPLYAVPEQVRRRLEGQKKQPSSNITSQRDKVPSREKLNVQTTRSTAHQTAYTNTTASAVSAKQAPPNPWMIQGKLEPHITQSSATAMSHDRSHGNKVPIGADPRYAVPDKPKFNTSNSSHVTGQSHDQASRVPIGQDPLYAVPDKVKARQQAAQRLNTSHASDSSYVSHDSHGMRSQMSSIPLSTIMSLTESSQTFLLRARDLWAKAEASLDSDSTVALMLFTQVNNLVSKLVQAEDVQTRPSLLQQLKETKEEGLKMCDILRPPQPAGSSDNDHVTRSSVSQGSCKRCGRTRNLDTQLLCGPCKLRVQLGQK